MERITGPLTIPRRSRPADSTLETAGVDVAAVRAEFIPAESVDFSDYGLNPLAIPAHRAGTVVTG